MGLERSYASATLRLLLLVAVIGLLFALIPAITPGSGPVAPGQQGLQTPIVGLNAPTDGEGVYEGCNPGTNECLAHLKTIAAGGFKLVMNYESLAGSASNLLAYASRAHDVGIKLIWGMSAPRFYDGTDLLHAYPDLAVTCGCSNNEGFLHYLLNLLKQQSATWGYYVGDEVDEHLLAQFTAYTHLLKQLDAQHPQLLIQGANTASDATSGLTPFAQSADVMGADFYPIGSTSNMMVNDAGKVAQAVQSVADEYGKGSAMVLQSFSWTQYPNENWRCGDLVTCPFPSRADMQQQLAMVLQHTRLRLILWYSYFDILKSDNPIRRWQDLVAAIASIS